MVVDARAKVRMMAQDGGGSGLGLEAFDYFEEVGGDGAGFGDGVGDGDAGDLGAFEDDEAAEVSCVDEVDGGDAVAGGQHAVVGCGGSSALGVAEVDGCGFRSRCASRFLRRGPGRCR